MIRVIKVCLLCKEIKEHYKDGYCEECYVKTKREHLKKHLKEYNHNYWIKNKKKIMKQRKKLRLKKRGEA